MPHDELTFSQGPIMTADHVEALRIVEGWWPFPGKLELGRIREVRRHLENLVAAPVMTMATGTREDRETGKTGDRAAGGYLDDWRLEYAPPTEDDCYDCDQ